MEFLSNFQYKKLFLPNITEAILANNADVQLYRLENYLKGILIPVIPYRTTFNFIIFVTKGYIRQHLENKEYYAQQGEIIFIKQGSITATLELSDDIEGFFLAYENNILSEQEMPKHKTSIFFISPFLTLDHLAYNTITQLLPVMEQELLLNNLNINDVVICMLHLILVKILYANSGSSQTSATRPMEVSLQFRDLLFKYHLEEKKAAFYAHKRQLFFLPDDLLFKYHLEEKKAAFYAHKMSVTENYLNKCVKNVTLKSVKHWINEIDINYSKALLQSSKDIAEIAYELNFHTASHFSQLFKKIAGITPKEYRTQFLNSKNTVSLPHEVL